VLGRVVELEADVVARLEAELMLQGVGEPGRPLVEVGVGQAPVATDDRLPVRDGVGDALEQVGDVERRYFASLPWPT